jgi:hypothetical protein
MVGNEVLPHTGLLGLLCWSAGLPLLLACGVFPNLRNNLSRSWRLIAELCVPHHDRHDFGEPKYPFRGMEARCVARLAFVYGRVDGRAAGRLIRTGRNDGRASLNFGN